MARSGKRTRGGRPSLLTKSVSAALLKAVTSGTPFTFACAAAGISYRTFQSWTRRGRLDQCAGRDTPFAAFVRDLKRAEAEGIAARLRLINRAARTDWRAAHAVNVSRYPEHFAANRHEVRQLRKELAEVNETLKLLLSDA
jgi:hypothetical protein